MRTVAKFRADAEAVAREQQRTAGNGERQVPVGDGKVAARAGSDAGRAEEQGVAVRIGQFGKIAAGRKSEISSHIAAIAKKQDRCAKII